jgi:uncharacterized membrane protein YcfT
MIEVLFYSTIAIIAVVILERYGQYCYKLGVMSSKGALNILCEETKDGFIFYNLLTETFICQSTAYDEGVTMLKLKHPSIDIVVSMAPMRSRIIDETI